MITRDNSIIIRGFSVEVEWDEDDGVYVADILETGCRAHGETPQDAFENAALVIDHLLVTG